MATTVSAEGASTWAAGPATSRSPSADQAPSSRQGLPRHAASIRNPEFDERQRARRGTWDTPRFLDGSDETADGDLVLPRGMQDLLTNLVDSAGSTLRIEDNRGTGERHEFACSTPFRTRQSAALAVLLGADMGVRAGQRKC
jgi:hypothetical protein